LRKPLAKSLGNEAAKTLQGRIFVGLPKQTEQRIKHFFTLFPDFSADLSASFFLQYG
jgi:hypothetical protein